VSLRRKVKAFFLLEAEWTFVAAAFTLWLRPSPATAGEPAPQSEGILPTGSGVGVCGCGLHLLPQVSLRRKVKAFFLLEAAWAFVAAAFTCYRR
jgi:hypothetical protein